MSNSWLQSAAFVLRGRLALHLLSSERRVKTYGEGTGTLASLKVMKSGRNLELFIFFCPSPGLLASKQQLQHRNRTSSWPPSPLSTRTPSVRKITVSKLLNKWPFKDLLTPLIVRKHLNNQQRLIMAAVERSGRTQTSILGGQLYLLGEGQSMERRQLPCAERHGGGDCRAPRAPHPAAITEVKIRTTHKRICQKNIRNARIRVDLCCRGEVRTLSGNLQAAEIS